MVSTPVIFMMQFPELARENDQAIRVDQEVDCLAFGK